MHQPQVWPRFTREPASRAPHRMIRTLQAGYVDKHNRRPCAGDSPPQRHIKNRRGRRGMEGEPSGPVPSALQPGLRHCPSQSTGPRTAMEKKDGDVFVFIFVFIVHSFCNSRTKHKRQNFHSIKRKKVRPHRNNCQIGVTSPPKLGAGGWVFFLQYFLHAIIEATWCTLITIALCVCMENMHHAGWNTARSQGMG